MVAEMDQVLVVLVAALDVVMMVASVAPEFAVM